MNTEQRKTFYENKAIAIAEKYGIVEWKVEKNIMTWLVSHRAYLNNPRYTVKHIYNLDTCEYTTQVLKRYNVKGEINR